MLTEAIMHVAGWDAVWYAHPGSVRRALEDPRWHVGVWTGPDNDLVCIRSVESAEEAEYVLSPGGRTIVDACLRACTRALVIAIRQLLGLPR